MTVYARQIATAKRIIGAKGETVIWRQIPDPTPADPAKPWIVPVAIPIDIPVVIAFFPFTRINNELLRQLAGTEIPTGDFYGLMASVTFNPALPDLVIRQNSDVCRIVSIDILKPDGTPILYTVNFKL